MMGIADCQLPIANWTLACLTNQLKEKASIKIANRQSAIGNRQ